MNNPEPKLVSFYKDGWRTGWLESTNGFSSVIRPLGPKGTVRRTVTIPADDVKEIAEK